MVEDTSLPRRERPERRSARWWWGGRSFKVIVLLAAVVGTLYAALVALSALAEPSSTVVAAFFVVSAVAAIYWFDWAVLARDVGQLWVIRLAVIGSFLAAIYYGVQALCGWSFATDRFIGWTAALAFLGAVILPLSQSALLLGAGILIQRGSGRHSSPNAHEACGEGQSHQRGFEACDEGITREAR